MTSAAAQRAFAYIVGVEGVLSMDPKDRGNWTGGRVGVGTLKGTKYGISAAAHPNLDIAALTVPDALRLFDEEYWSACRCDELPYPLALCVADDAYNHGASFACRTLQQALNVTVDGVIGNATLSAIRLRRVRDLVVHFQALRAMAYAHDPALEHEGLGWFENRVLGTAFEALAGEP